MAVTNVRDIDIKSPVPEKVNKKREKDKNGRSVFVRERDRMI